MKSNLKKSNFGVCSAFFFLAVIRWESRMAEDYKPGLIRFMRGWQNTDVFILTFPFSDYAQRLHLLDLPPALTFANTMVHENHDHRFCGDRAQS